MTEHSIFTDILSIEFLRLAFIGALLSSASTSVISVFVSLKKIAYMGEAFSHISFAGIAVALLFGLNFNITTTIFVIAVAFLIGIIAKKYRFEESNITTIFLSVSMAFGIILLSINKNYTIDIEGYLFGNVLLVAKNDIYPLITLFILNILFLILFFKELFYITYNEEISKIYRIPVKPIYFMFLTLIAMNIVVSVKIIGVILVTAQLILPGITALNLTNKIRIAIIISFILSELSTIAGFFTSYYLNLPSGASIVIIMFLAFLFSLIIKSFYFKRA